jgi:hypothetical protein
MKTTIVTGRLAVSALLLIACDAGGNEDNSPASAESAVATPRVSGTLASCSSLENPAIKYTVAIDEAYRVSWTGPWTNGSSILTSARLEWDPEFATDIFVLDLVSKDGFSMTQDQLDGPIGRADCGGEVVVNVALRDRLIADNRRSMEAQRDFAHCAFSGPDENETVKVRPSLDHRGALFEAPRSYRGWSFIGRSLEEGAAAEKTYVGEGGYSVYNPQDPFQSPFLFSQLTVKGGPPPTITWNAGSPLGATSCEIVGTDYAASLLPR